MRKRKRKKRRSVLQSREKRTPRRSLKNLQTTLDRAERLILRGRAQAAIELLEPFVESHPREAELHYHLGYAHARAGNNWEALSGYERAQELSRDPSYWFPLALLYAESGLRIHALRAFRQAIKHQDDFPLTGEVPKVVAGLEKDMADLARSLDLPVGRVEKGLYHMERGRRALTGNNFQASIAASRQAIRLLGDWPPPHNNLALALFWNGQPEEAIVAARRVLSRTPDNVHALGNAIRYLAWTGQEAEARELWARLKTITPPDDDARRKIVEAAAILDEDEYIYQLLRPLAGARPGQAWDKEPSQVTAQEQFFLAIAEANTNRRRDAQRRLQVLQRDWTRATEPLKALKAGRTGMGWSERFSHFHSTELLPRGEMEKFIELTQHQDDLPAKRFRSEIGHFAARFPQVIRMAEKLILEEGHPDAGIGILTTIATPEAYDALRRFGLSQIGEDEARLEALTRLMEAKEITKDETLRLWIEGEWREVQLRMYEISDEDEAAYAPEVADLVNRGIVAHQQDDHEQAERLFRRVLELEPRAKEAYNNLGAIHARRGEHVEARKMFQRAVEIDPLYAIPRCNLASYLLEHDDVEGAQAMLKPLSNKTQFHPQAAAFYSYTQARILLRRDEYDAARRVLRAALEVYPDYELAKDLLEHLDRTVPLLESFRAISEQQRQHDRAKRARMQAKLTTPSPSLSKALSLYTKDALTGMGRVVLFEGGWSALRKAELVQEIVERLADLHNLERIVTDLSEDERDALRQVLMGGGSMPWQDFDARYGNDLEESPHWNWHTPETTMGRLRLRGLLVEATVDNELRVVIPVELRQRLRKVLD